MTKEAAATSAAQSGEFGRIARLLKPLAMPEGLGLADDAALLTLPPDMQLVVTTDAMVAGVHFLPGDAPSDVAAKLLRVNLSDLAAMAADPLGYSLVTSLPRDLDESWLAGFAAGLAEEQQRFGIGLLGGDSVSTSGPITVMVSALGLVPQGRAMRRNSARPGDLVAVTGSIGDAALGLRIATGALAAAEPDRTHLLGRLRRPEPRLAMNAALRRHAASGIDISDGLVADLGHVAAASGVRLVIEAAQVPLSEPARRLVAADPALLAALLTGGDDYELGVTLSPGSLADLQGAAQRAGIPLTAIGRVEAAGPDGPGVTILGTDGMPLATGRGGWTHF